MKVYTARLTGIAAVLALIAFSCTKVSVAVPEEIESKKLKKTRCDLQSITQSYAGNESYLFKKTYDPSGKHVRQLEAGLYSGGGIAYTVQLNVEYTNNAVYFLSAANAADTGLIVQLDKDGRPQKVTAGHIIDYGFGPQEFFYSQGRLQLINVDNNWMRIWFRYDAWGNLIQTVTDSTNGFAGINVVFEYDHNRQASNQFYQDEARGFSFNVLTILHQANFFPELNPVHVRTRSTVLWGPYVAYDFDLIDHVIDNGQLMSYRIRSHNYGWLGAYYKAEWDCGRRDDEVVAAY